MAIPVITGAHRASKTRHLVTQYLLLCVLLSPAMASSDSERAPLVVVATAKTDTVTRQVPLTGTITSARVSQLSAEISGRVDKVNVEVGDRVKTGAALIELDREIEQLTLDSLLAQTQQAEAELADARRRYQDAVELRIKNSISENAMKLLKAEVQIDAATLKQQQAEQRRQRARVERHTLRAPFDGVITDRATEAGEWIQPGNPVLTLVADDELRIEFRVPQEFFGRIDAGTAVSVTLDVMPGRDYDGSIKAIVPVSDTSSRTFLMHVTIEADEAQITPGMSVQGQLMLNTGREGVVVSRDAILRYPDGRVTVWVIDPGSEPATVLEKRVTTGNSFAGMITIRDGIQAGDVVIVRGNEALKEGQQVRILPRE